MDFFCCLGLLLFEPDILFFFLSVLILENGSFMVLQQLSFEDYLNEKAALVEHFLHDTIFSQKSTLSLQWPERLKKAMEHGVMGGGKRLRPFLTLETAQLLKGREDNALQAGAALELIHCYSLIHDDLPAMDDDELRRGQPTVHRAYDEATAILAGDALLTLAFELLASEKTHPDPSIRVNCILALSKAAGASGMVGGQMLDLAAEGRFDTARPSLPEIRNLQAMKTGALICAAVELGALISQASHEQKNALLQFAQALGAAFQIADDILDRESTTEEMGKKTGKDQEKGKGTLVDILGLDAAREECTHLQNKAFKALEFFGKDADILRSAFIFAVKRKI